LLRKFDGHLAVEAGSSDDRDLAVHLFDNALYYRLMFGGRQ
jgi:hypothetical protein